MPQWKLQGQASSQAQPGKDKTLNYEMKGGGRGCLQVGDAHGDSGWVRRVSAPPEPALCALLAGFVTWPAPSCPLTLLTLFFSFSGSPLGRRGLVRTPFLSAAFTNSCSHPQASSPAVGQGPTPWPPSHIPEALWAPIPYPLTQGGSDAPSTALEVL